MIKTSLAVLIALGFGAGAALAQADSKMMIPALTVEQAKTYVFDLKADKSKVVASAIHEVTDTSRSGGGMPDFSKLKPNFSYER